MKIQTPIQIAGLVLGVLFMATQGGANLRAATLTGGFASIPRNSVIDLSSSGPIDWVHWGLYSEASLNRKANVTPLISDFTTISGGHSNAFAYAYQFVDNYNGYSWSDGTPTLAVTDTRTGVWAYGIPLNGTGFELTVPAATSERTLKVYVGAYAARGRFEASLSDSSAGPYSNSSLANMMGNGPSGIYTITYAAASAGQTLRIQWTLQQSFRPDGNVTLQAAALSSAGANNPPSVALTSPAPDSTFNTPASIDFEASARDLDGRIARVEFQANDVKVGEATSDPYRFTWSGVGTGFYSLKAIAYDDGGELSESKAVEVFVSGSGGSLGATVALPPANVNLTSEGTSDWTHWGLNTSNLFNRKTTTTPQLGTFIPIGNNPVQRYEDNFTGYSWTDGAPTPSASASHTGVFIVGEGQGFALDLPADLTTRTARIYVGLYGAQGTFQAYLSDFSAAAYTDESLENVFGNEYAVYRLVYSAARAGQVLHIRYRAKQLYDNEFGNVTLQAVTLVGGDSHPNEPPAVSLLTPTNNAAFIAPATITFSASASDDGGITKVQFLQGADVLGEDSTGPGPYTFTWPNVPAGTYVLSARATDNFGLSTSSSAVTVMVSNPLPSAVTLLDPIGSNTAFSFSFASQSGRAYEVQFSGHLGSNDWQLLQTLTGNGSSLTVTDVNPPAGQRFYRVISQ